MSGAKEILLDEQKGEGEEVSIYNKRVLNPIPPFPPENLTLIFFGNLSIQYLAEKVFQKSYSKSSLLRFLTQRCKNFKEIFFYHSITRSEI